MLSTMKNARECKRNHYNLFQKEVMKLREAYQDAAEECYNAELQVMQSIIDILLIADKPMKASELARYCKYDVSSNEISGNLIAINTNTSRFIEHGQKKIPINRKWLNTYGKSLNYVEEFEYTHFCECDEDGNIIPGGRTHISKKVVTKWFFK